ncbi:MAG TPA: hypothetical protein VGZ02_13105 [Candidatus Baltobacteraceae bacterium]|nr:hypothetical protein [Candidatus Baltobacteraceae bacterium]
MVARLKNIAPVQAGLVYAALYGIIGLLFAAIFVPISMATSAAMPSSAGPGRAFGVVFGLAGLVIFPVFYAVSGFVGGLVIAALYNLVAGWTGGLQITLAPVEAPVAPASYSPPA